MVFQFKANTGPSTTGSSCSPKSTANLPTRETTSDSKAANIQSATWNPLFRVELPRLPDSCTTPGSLDTSLANEANQPRFVGNESKHTGDDEEAEKLSDMDRDERSDDGDGVRDKDSEESSGEDEDESSDEDEDDSSYEDEDESSDADEEESSDDDGECDHTIPEEEVTALLLEAKAPLRSIQKPHTLANTAFPATVLATGDDKDGKTMNQTHITGRNGKTDEMRNSADPSVSTANFKPQSFVPETASPLANTSALGRTPDRAPIPQSTAAWDSDSKFILSKFNSKNLSKSLLFSNVFNIKEIDRKDHTCRIVDMQQGIRCNSSVLTVYLDEMVKLIGKSLESRNRLDDKDIYKLALYNTCPRHSLDSTVLARMWIRYAELTEDLLSDWHTSYMQADCMGPIPGYAAREISRAMRQDSKARSSQQETIKLYDESKRTVESLRTKINNNESEISTLKKHINTLTTEISSLKESQDSSEIKLKEERDRALRDVTIADGLYAVSQEGAKVLQKEFSVLTSRLMEMTTENASLKETLDLTKDAHLKENARTLQDHYSVKDRLIESEKTVEALQKELSALKSKNGELTAEITSLKEKYETTESAFIEDKKRDQQHLQDTKDLYENSQTTVEALRKEIDALNSRISEHTTIESSLKSSLEITQNSLIAEKVRSRELEIRLEERVPLPSGISDTSDSKLETYLRSELEKSHQRVQKQQQDFENLRNDHVRLQITHATLETQLKQLETLKQEQSLASKREFQELAERNSDLSNELQHTRSQFEHLKAELVSMEKEHGGEMAKGKFSLREMMKRAKKEPSRVQTPSSDHS